MSTQKKRRAGGVIVIGTVILFSLLAGARILSWAAEKATIPDSITLSEYNRTAGLVTFIHKDHGGTGDQKPACSVCHHTTAWDQTPQKCSVCHMPIDDTAAPTDTVAFHKLCIGCHKTEIEHGNKRIDLACDSCHAPER